MTPDQLLAFKAQEQGTVAKIILRHESSSSAFRSRSDPKQTLDELRLAHHVVSVQSFNLTFPYHVHSFNPFECSFRCMETLKGL
jgi:hypothetical protein